MGFFALQPNEARVLVLFGQYTGTVRTEGFHWANPFSVKRGGVTTVTNEKHAGQQQQVVAKPNRYHVSLRARNFETQKLKVNDQRGNPIEIAAVIVWSVRDTAQAIFDVDDYENYVQIQQRRGYAISRTVIPTITPRTRQKAKRRCATVRKKSARRCNANSRNA